MCPEPEWPTLALDAFKHIVADHFRIGVRSYSLMETGSYARLYLFTLENDFQAVGRVVFPVRETVKTEAEIAVMELVRSRTDIPVPQVYLYCSLVNNPVGAEWILMEYLPGEPLGDCFEKLNHEQKLRTSADLAGIMSSLFSITTSRIGSLLQARCKDNSQLLNHHCLRYPVDGYCHPSYEVPRDVEFCIGPMNDITFLDYPDQVSPEFCGPFDSEFEFLEAFAFRARPPTRQNTDYSAFEKIIQVYRTVRPLYRGFACSSSDRPNETFHLAHGDLSSWNILVDSTTGAITGVVDWEMAGFRPAWLAAVAPGWFNDDSDRFLMTDDQSCRLEYADDIIRDPELLPHFRVQLASRNMELFRHYWLGPELRALFYACSYTYAGNAENWLRKYEEQEWNVEQRGAFPFDSRAWLWEKWTRKDVTRKWREGVVPLESCTKSGREDVGADDDLRD